MIDSEVARRREQFLRSGEPEIAPGIRDEIALSWMRSTLCSVRPEVVDPPYRSDFSTQSRLLRAAEPVLNAMEDRLAGLGVSVIVSDGTGLIVARRVSDKGMRSRLDRLCISPGHLFSEDAVGTNGIGTAIEIGRATRVDGHEHYLDKYVDFTCVGVPISDPIQQRPVGILDVTTRADPENEAIELLTEQIGRAIEERLLEQHSLHERSLLDHFMRANRRTRAGLVVLSDRILMANPQAARLFEDMDHPLLWDHASRALSSSDPIIDEFVLDDGTLVATRTTAVRDGGEAIGSAMEIRRLVDRRERVHPGGRSSVQILEHRSRAESIPFPATSYTTGMASVGTRTVLVCGEPGVGKATFASALLRDNNATGTDEPPTYDAALAGVDGGHEWLAKLGELLREQPKDLLIRHVELLDDDTTRRLVPLLRSAQARGTRCVLTRTCGEMSDDSTFSALEAETIRLPPLRDRPNDLPALVAAHLGDRRLAPEVLQLFLRCQWPGNITQLFSVLREMAAASPRQTLGLNDVPAELRRSAPRRPLSRFEQAELHVILDALAETGGNKQQAASLIGISRSTLYRKLQNAGVDLENTVY
ncbi:sigma-54-dependent Fis family transcriptional regulator [Mycobacterium paraffinicum]|uniref:sigma-54-dependent Fis family transcriptional regulator n=1 Tax=Mycobacterium paraffinicum TaxID=53378 RepID=UPI0009FD58BC|nr:helix-turn-helix domain-containing protein [Mycobacterium paraffinicum]